MSNNECHGKAADRRRLQPCQAACSKCDQSAADSPQAGAPVGWRLVLAASGTFLLPLATAIAGAIVAGGSDTRRLVGACVGLGVGLSTAILTSRMARHMGPGGQHRHDVRFPAVGKESP